MRCAACGAVNDQGRAYCGGCAHSLCRPCPACQFLNAEGVRYCGGCAGDLLAAVARSSSTAIAIPVFTAAGAAPNIAATAIFSDLGDLISGRAPAAGGETPRAADGDATQEEIDGFFQRLVREGVAEMQPPGAPGRAPPASGDAPS